MFSTEPGSCLNSSQVASLIKLAAMQEDPPLSVDKQTVPLCASSAHCGTEQQIKAGYTQMGSSEENIHCSH